MTVDVTMSPVSSNGSPVMVVADSWWLTTDLLVCIRPTERSWPDHRLAPLTSWHSVSLMWLSTLGLVNRGDALRPRSSGSSGDLCRPHFDAVDSLLASVSCRSWQNGLGISGTRGRSWTVARRLAAFPTAADGNTCISGSMVKRLVQNSPGGDTLNKCTLHNCWYYSTLSRSLSDIN